MPHYDFYHGTSLDQAKKLMNLDMTPVDYEALGWYEYTDFGKGFYTHTEENRKMAADWAKRKHPEWGVVRFRLTDNEFTSIAGKPLHFHNKRAHRPGNAPVLFNSQAANWIEFVEYNRGIRTSAMRPKDNDWTPHYSWMRGPIWGRVDSGMPGGGPPIPDHIQQMNWGKAGLNTLNTDAAKKRRLLITKDNEHELDANVDELPKPPTKLVMSGAIPTSAIINRINCILDEWWISSDDVAAIETLLLSVKTRPT